MVGVNGERYNDREVWTPVYYPSASKPGDAMWVALGRGEKRGGIDLRLGAPRTPAVLRIEFVLADGRPAIGVGASVDDLEGRQRVHVKSDGTTALLAPVFIGESYQVSGFHYEGQGSTLRGKSAAITIAGAETSVRVVLVKERW